MFNFARPGMLIIFHVLGWDKETRKKKSASEGRGDAQVTAERFRTQLNKQVFFALYLKDGVESDRSVWNAIV